MRLGIIFTLLSSLLLFDQAFSQSADKDKGCVPLEVNFNAPAASNYYWDFDDGTTSDLQNPVHNFSSAGEFTVQLYDAVGGTLVGEIQISVFPEVTVELNLDDDLGCVPFDVSIQALLNISPEINLQNASWTFGDGQTASGLSTNHTYTFEGIFDLSLDLITDIDECNKTILFEDVITTEDPSQEIILPENLGCVAPVSVTFKTTKEERDNYQYRWDFGNGEESITYDPGEIIYQELGEYEVTLSITSDSGCNFMTTETLIIGPPKLVFNAPDTVCINEAFTINNSTDANRFEWFFDDPLMRSFRKNLSHTFETPGEKEIVFKASYNGQCASDTTFTILVDEPDASFSLEPAFLCDENQELKFVANNRDQAEYRWNFQDPQGPEIVIREAVERDSLYIHVPEELQGHLEVVSPAGCKASSSQTFEYRLTEAYFIPDRVVGVNTLSVTFEDLSRSDGEIVQRYWIYGDGQEGEVDPDVVEHVHIYSTCGVFFPRLVVVNEFGCIDTSKAVRIDILCVDEGEGNPAMCNPSALDVCVGESIDFMITGPTFLDYHVDTDDDRMSHCWPDMSPSHTFNFPGAYPLFFSVEYRGFELANSYLTDILVRGARAEIQFTKDCDNIFDASFESESLHADKLTWTYEGNVISDAQKFKYTFDALGEHIVYLDAENTQSGCPPDRDSVIVYVTEPKAEFSIPPQLCDNEPFPLNAAASKDYFNSCYKGFLWEFEFQRPRETGKEVLNHQFARGPQEVSLTVEDINGCTDKITRSTTVYGIEPENNLDSTTCLPFPAQLQDLSESDTTLVSWNWSFGSNEQNPFYIFDTTDINPIFEDTIVVTFQMEDALGCKDEITKYIQVVDPEFLVASNAGTRVCVGEDIEFVAVDTAGVSASYEFEWVFGDGNTTQGDRVAHQFEEAGSYEVLMISQHRNGSCLDTTIFNLRVLDSPSAEFTSDVDDLEQLCYPAQISFENQNTSQAGLSYEWDFGDGDAMSELPSPTIEFGEGTHDVSLIVTNSIGCQDSTTRSFTLVGPTGDLSISQESFCLFEEVTFTLNDTAFVNSFTWDFGDGQTADNENPVSHQYLFRPPGDSTIVKLILRSDQYDCNVTKELPIFIEDIEANIGIGEGILLCNGELNIENNSTNATDFLWEFGDGNTSTEVNPEHVYETIGDYQIILTATDVESGCSATDTLMVTPSAVGEKDQIMPNIFSPNEDGHNDFFAPAEVLFNEGLEILNFKIYNRWGQLVYDNQNPQGWDGRFNDKPSPPEVYGYHIDVSLDGCVLLSEKGNVTLIR